MRETRYTVGTKDIGNSDLHSSSVRKTAKILSEFHPVSKSTVHKWIKKFEERLPIVAEKKPRKVVAINETGS